MINRPSTAPVPSNNCNFLYFNHFHFPITWNIVTIVMFQFKSHVLSYMKTFGETHSVTILPSVMGCSLPPSFTVALTIITVIIFIYTNPFFVCLYSHSRNNCTECNHFCLFLFAALPIMNRFLPAGSSTSSSPHPVAALLPRDLLRTHRQGGATKTDRWTWWCCWWWWWWWLQCSQIVTTVLRDAMAVIIGSLAGDEHGVTVFLYRPVSHVNYFRWMISPTVIKKVFLLPLPNTW